VPYTVSAYHGLVASRQGGPDADGASATDSHGVSLTNAPAGPTAATGEGGLREGASLPTRDPGSYAQTDHFRERLRQTGRYVSLPLVAAVVRDGQFRYNSTDGWRFADVIDGVRVVVVVSDTDTDSPVLVTGWTELADRETALAADRWSSVDVETIALRTDLSDAPDRQVPGRIRPRVVSRPFELGDHSVRTAAGDAYVECVDCGGRYRSKRALSECRCVGGVD
jgi:hypothetical protein